MHSYDSAWILRRIPWDINETTLSNSPTPENIVIPEQERFDSQTELDRMFKIVGIIFPRS